VSETSFELRLSISRCVTCDVYSYSSTVLRTVGGASENKRKILTPPSRASTRYSRSENEGFDSDTGTVLL
jgi:hypothetical protein